MDIDSSKIRTTLGDAQGVIHLKEVLKNIARLHSEATSPQAKAEGWGMSQSDDPRYAQPETEKKVEKPKKKDEDVASYDLAQLGDTVEDGICADLLGDEHQGSVLRSCGSRISGLCSRLHAMESQAPRARLAYDSSTNIRIVDRPEEAASVQRARAERATMEDITKHEKFPLLDTLDEHMNKSNTYEEVRKHFQTRNRHHERLVYLTDYAVLDRESFLAAVWNKEGDHGARSRNHSSSATQLPGVSAAGRQAQPGGQPVRKARFRRDFSAPSLRP